MNELELLIKKNFDEHLIISDVTYTKLNKLIQEASSLIINCFKNGNKVLLFGNGGSASDAQHISAEFVGRFVKERLPLPSIALNTDTSAITAISNDYGYENVFKRQVKALANKGDVLIGITTSGNSMNVINAINEGKSLGCFSIGLSGCNGGKMNNVCDVNIVIPSNTTARIQEMHILIGHIFCDLVDASY